MISKYIIEQRLERYNKQIEPLKKDLQAMLVNDSLNMGNKMGLIDAVECLGISYFYGHEIKVMLDQIF